MLGKMEIRTPPGSRPRDGRHCDLCGCSQPAVRCDKCGCQIFCLSCDDMYHRHPKRRFHLRKAVDPITSVPQARPVLPAKVSQLNAMNPGDPSKMPLPPPRKKKSIFGSFRKPSPTSDNSPPLPKKEYSWTDRLGSIKKFMSNRPLPPLPTSDDDNFEPQPTTNGQSPRGDLSFIHKRSEERPPQLPQRSPRTPELPGINQEKENRIPSSQPHLPGQIRNGSHEPNGNHMNQNHDFSNNEQNQWNNRMHNQNGAQAFGTLNRQTHQRGFGPPGAPGYPGGMHQSSSATDLHNLHNAEGMPGAGPVPPMHYPHYPVNPHMPPHYPYPMYPQYPNYPQYFGNSFANISNPPTTSEGDLSDSEASSRHSSKKHPFRKRAKRSQSMMVDKMAYPGQFFPFGPYPGYGPWGAPMQMEAPPSPASSIRSLNRAGRSRRRKKTTSEDDDEELSETSSPMSRPKSSSSDPKEQPRAPLGTEDTSSGDESDDNRNERRNKNSTIRRQLEPVKIPSPAAQSKRIAKLKKSSSKQSDSDTQEIPEARSERRPSDSTTEQQQHVRQSPLPQQQSARQSPLPQQPSVRQSPLPQQPSVRQSPLRQPSPMRQSPARQPSPMRQSPAHQQTFVQQQPSTSASSSAPPDYWECKHCTFINPNENRICQVCCKTNSARTETPVSAQSRPTSSAASNRKESEGSEKECSSPDKAQESEDSRKERQDMASLNSALDEAEKQISRGLEELMKLKDDIDANKSNEKSENQSKPESDDKSKPTYRSSGKMRTSILDKLNLNKPQSSNASVSTSTETQTNQNNWTQDKIIEARGRSNSSTPSDTYNSPMAQSPELERAFPGNKQKRDSSCQTQQDTIGEYLEKRKAAEEAYLGRPLNNFGFGYGDRMDMVTSPVPSMYDRFFGGGYGMMQRSHSRASLFAGRMNDMGPMDYGPGFGYGPAPMYRSVSRGSLTGEYPDGRMSEFHGLRKPDFYLSMEELVERRRQDSIRAQGLELVRMIREAEQQGFNADDIQVALTHCGKQNPMEWLQENWRNMVDSVVTLATNYGNDKKENDIGLLSENEARDALRLHKGNIWAAVTECVEGRQRKYLELCARGSFSRQDIVDALTASDGDVEMAYANLSKSTGKPFLMRIWGQGEGAQNQDGAQPIPEHFNQGPHRYLKDETLNSDELSDDLWSEEGDVVDWDEEEEYEGAMGDIEDLRTCQEDLQTGPQEMVTPESEKSDYIDAFSVDDRNASSPSDDIFFVIPEAKPEKKKGFLSKLVALRKDSKEQADTSLNTVKEGSVSEQVLQSKEDSISQKSNSSLEQPKNNGAFQSLKSTLSAIKDSVTGGSKNDKKLPCTQPERRTIVVGGQISPETLISDSKDNVKLLEEDSAATPKLEIQSREQIKTDPLLKDAVKSEKDDSSKTGKNIQPVNDLSQSIATDSENVTKPKDPQKAEIKKPQSLAERLKLSKQYRSSTNVSGSSTIKTDDSISDKVATEDFQTKKEKQLQNQEHLNSKTASAKDESAEETKLNQIVQDGNLKTHNSEYTIHIQQDVAEKDIIHGGSRFQNKTQRDTLGETSNISALQQQDVLKESKVEIKTNSSKSNSLTRKAKNELETNQVKQVETSKKNKIEDLRNKTSVPENSRSQSNSDRTESSQLDKASESDSKSVSVKERDKSSSKQISDAVKKEYGPKTDILKHVSSISHINVSTDLKVDHSPTDKSNAVETTEEKVGTEAAESKNIPITPESKDSVETESKQLASERSVDTTKSIKEVNKITDEQTENKTDIPKSSTETSETKMASEDSKNSLPETSSNQKLEIKPENLKIDEDMNQATTKENLAVKNGENVETPSVEKASVVNKDPSTTKKILKNESENPTENSKIHTTLTETESTLHESDVNKSVQENSLKQSPVSEVQNNVAKSEAVPSYIQPNLQLPNTSASSNQIAPENIIQQPAIDTSKRDLESNGSTSEIKTVLESPVELSAQNQTNAEQNLDVPAKEKYLTTSEPTEGSSKISVQNNEVMQRKDLDVTSTQNQGNSSENSQDATIAGLNISKDDTALDNKDTTVSSVNEDAKDVKPKSTKTTKIKKSKLQEKYKESNDKTATKLESPSSSVISTLASDSGTNISHNDSNSRNGASIEQDKKESADKFAAKSESPSSSVISPLASDSIANISHDESNSISGASIEQDKKESEDKIAAQSEPSSPNTSSSIASDSKSNRSPVDVSLKTETPLPNKDTNEQVDNKSENLSKSDNKTSESELMTSENESVKTLPENELKTPEEENTSTSMKTLENASGTSVEPIQDATASIKLQSSPSAVGVTFPSTSNNETTSTIQETQKKPEIPQKSDSSKEINQNSSEVTGKPSSNDTELQAPVFSKEFPDNKGNVTVDATSPSELTDISKITETSANVPDNSTTISTSVDKTIPVNSEIIEVTSPNASDNMKTVSSSSNTNNLQASDTTGVTTTNIPDNSETIAISSNGTNVDNSKTTVASLTTNIPDNSETIAISSNVTNVDNSKTAVASLTTNIPDNSETIAISSNVTNVDISKTAVASLTTNIPDNSETIAISSNATNVDISKTAVASLTTNIPDNSETIAIPSNVTNVDNSKTAVASSSTTVSDNMIPASSNLTTTENTKISVASSSTKVPDNSKTVPAHSNTTASSSSKITTAPSSGLSKTVTGVKSSEKDTSTVLEKHSKAHGIITDIPASINNQKSSPANAINSSRSRILRRTKSEENSQPKSVDSDDTDSEYSDYSDNSRRGSMILPSPVDTLRSRFEGLASGSVTDGPIRPASPFRRMSFNSRKQVIALEKKRDITTDKPWFKKKVVPEPAKIIQPKRSIRQQLEMERRVRQMVSDRKIRTYRKAEIVVQLMDMNFEEEEAILAANECSTLEQAISYLQQECLLCAGHYPVSQIISMTHCEHMACRECIRAYFTVQIRDRTILDLLCPFCNEPDIGDEDVAQDYFNHLDIMLKKLVDTEIHELFQRKLRDRVLMKDPNFRWCSQCSSGFIAMPNLKRLICPDCNAVTCASCRRLWEKEHQGISCEAFAAMKDASDPEAQAAGLAKMLTEDGISCPSCHFRYALAKGGCMHFRCIQCQHDFCSGCSRPFKMGQKCGVSEFCVKLGLHAHHPRNCLFYLRDKEPEDLQKLLDMNEVKYNREPPDGIEQKSTCEVLEQKETADGMIDDYCGKDVQEGYAGLCRVHYVEYLGQLVNKHKVDPIQIFDNDDLELVLRRANIRLPPKRYRETDAGYREKLINVIQEELPLDKMDGS